LKRQYYKKESKKIYFFGIIDICLVQKKILIFLLIQSFLLLVLIFSDFHENYNPIILYIC